MTIRNLRAIVTALCMLFVGAGYAVAGSHGGIELSPVEVRATIPGMTASGGYLVIMNHGSVADRLVAVSTPVAAKSQIHEMMNEDGVMKMRHRSQGIEILPHQMVALKPGGLHLMFMGLNRTLNPDDEFAVTLTFESGHTATVTATVKRPGDLGAADPHAGMKHGHAHGSGEAGHDHSGNGH